MVRHFFMDVFRVGRVFKRVDLAINDKTSILDNPFSTEKCRHEEKSDMGTFINSLKSDVYFCAYKKDYEQ